MLQVKGCHRCDCCTSLHQLDHKVCYSLGITGFDLVFRGRPHLGLEVVEVELDDLVILGALISAQVLPEGVSQLGGWLAAGGHQVIVLALVEGEHGGGRANLSAHIADRAHPWNTPHPTWLSENPHPCITVLGCDS
jgi:hypothetical protein